MMYSGHLTLVAIGRHRCAKTGATVIGARPFLIAWNINLNTNNQRKTEKIAATIRDKGSYVRDENGELKRGEDGKPFRAPGCFVI